MRYGDIITLPHGGKRLVIAELDFETYSEAGFFWNDDLQKFKGPENSLKKGIQVTGAAAYAEHPTCEVLSCAYDLKDGLGPRLWKPGQRPPFDLFAHIQAGRLIEAWNCAFERWIYIHVCFKKYGWPWMPPLQWRDAAAKALAFGLPRSLEKAGEVIGANIQKNKEGKRLIDKFCVPRNPTKKDIRRRILLTHDPVDAELLYNYNRQDVEAECAISNSLPDLSDFETLFWSYDQLINYRGIQIDVSSIRRAIELIEKTKDTYTLELKILTNNAISSVSEVAKIVSYLTTNENVYLASLDEEHVSEALSRPNLPPVARRILEIRSMLSSSSVKKLYAMMNQVTSDGRLHDLLVYHGARTGRESGAGVQPQNLPNSGPALNRCPQCGSYYDIQFDHCGNCYLQIDEPRIVEWGPEPMEFAINAINRGRVSDYFSNPFEIVSGCLRGFFTAKKGHDLICSDYSMIEAVVLAMLANEPWRIEVFKTHGKMYELSASKISGVSFDEILDYRERTGNHHPLRKTVGKVAELALGYSGWLGAWKTFDKSGRFSDDEIKRNILKWRDESPNVVEFWGGQRRNWNMELFGLEGAAIQAILNPGCEFKVKSISYQVIDDILYCQLPSGRRIVYHKPGLDMSSRRPGEYQIYFHGWNSNGLKGAVGWQKMETYGGKLCENVVQAVARDILANAVVNLETNGYPIVLHVHDEIIAEVPEGDIHTIEEFEKIMMLMPRWAEGWPIKAAGGWRRKRYCK